MTTIKITLQSLCLAFIACCSTFVMQAQEPAFAWANGMGSSKSNNFLAYDMANKVVVDAQGNSYITGRFRDSADFDPGPGVAILRAAPDTIGSGPAFSNIDIFIAKYDKDGKYVWAKGLGNSGVDESLAIAIDAKANIYITGYFEYTVDFDPGTGTAKLTATGLQDIFVAKYDTDGNYVWAFNLGGQPPYQVDYDLGYGIDVDAQGNVYVSGTFNDEIDVNPDPNNTNILRTAGGNCGFIAKYNTDGKYIWALALALGSIPKTSSSFAYSIPYDIKVDDESGKVYIAGYFSSSTVYFSKDSSSYLIDNRSGYGSAAFLAQYDTSGNHQWSFSIGDTINGRYTYAYGIGIDGSSNVYLTGYVNSLADFNPGSGTATPSTTAARTYLAKYNSRGEYQYVLFHEPKTGGSMGYGMSITKRSVYLTGFLSGTVDFDPGPDSAKLTSKGSYDIFVAQYDTAGNYVWAKNIGGISSDWGMSITTDPAGNNLFVCGRYGQTVDFDPGPDSFKLTSVAASSSYNAFLFKLKICDGDTTFIHVQTQCTDTIVNDEIYTTSGTYMQYYPLSVSCDSLVAVVFEQDTKLPERPEVNVNVFVLGTTQSYATYQWLLDDVAIPGATDRYYTVTQNGNYRVYVTNEKGCSDTSAVYAITNVGMDEVQRLSSQVHVYPNPTENMLYIKSPVRIQVSVQGVDGRVLPAEMKHNSISMQSFTPGIYFLRIADAEGKLIKVEKVVKQ